MLRKELTAEPRIQPTFIEPMQVLPVRELPDGGNWTYEAKLDGYRCLAARHKGALTFVFQARHSLHDPFQNCCWVRPYS